MTYNPNEARLFTVDAGRTSSERSDARRYWSNQSSTLFELDPEPAPVCPVCNNEHRADQCPHGTAPDLFTTTPGDPAGI
jgi:hypothetical protein